MIKEMGLKVYYGEVYYVNFDDIQNDVPNFQHGIRPAVIVSNNSNNLFCNLVTIIPLTTRRDKLPQHQEIWIRGIKNYILPECIMTISKDRLLDKIWSVRRECDVEKLRKAMIIQFNIKNI